MSNRPAGFVNRDRELAALADWWSRRDASMALVWGRRRVGKTALLQAFTSDRRAVFHTGSARPLPAELALLSRASSGVLGLAWRDLRVRPFATWDDALETFAASAAEEPLLVVLDEFPELVRVAPELPSSMRAFWDRARTSSKLRLLVCGSAVRTMRAMQEVREPLYGRFDLVLRVDPFRPHEVAAMLPGLKAAERALVWGMAGGVPLYLSMWDQSANLAENLFRLFCSPGAALLNEGQLVLVTEGESGELGRLVLHAIASGRTKHNEIADAVRAEPSRTLERLVELGLVERILPVTEDPRRSRRRIYRVADNLLAFWLGVLDRYRPEIERGLGTRIVEALVRDLDDYMGARWEEAFREHLRRLAVEGVLDPDVVAVGPWWREGGRDQIDAVALAGRRRAAVLAGEAKWARSVDAGPIVRALERKAEGLPRVKEPIGYAVCARERVRGAGARTLVVSAADVFDS